VVQEFAGSFLAAFFAAQAFFFPAVVLKDDRYSVAAPLFFAFLLVLDEIGLDKAKMNPVLHFQSVFTKTKREFGDFIAAVVNSLVDLLGFAAGNMAALKLLRTADSDLHFDPLPPKAWFAGQDFHFAEVFLVEAAIVLVCEFFSSWLRMVVKSKRLVQVLEAAFITGVVFLFVDVTGGYGNPNAYFGRVIISNNMSINHPFATAYFFGPFLGGILAIPLLKNKKPREMEKEKDL